MPDRSSSSAPVSTRDPQTLVDLLRQRAAEHRPGWAYRFLAGDDEAVSISYAELDEQARAIAVALLNHVRPGDRALLVYPAGLEFIAGFFGCLYAGVLPVPATYPKPRRPMPRLSAIDADCGAPVALTTAATLATLDLARVAPDLGALTWISSDALQKRRPEAWQPPDVGPSSLAFLQYTSGSTSEPKGVMVSHANLLHNLAVIREGFDIRPIEAGEEAGTGVFWLPAYHDMGLIGGILMPLYAGGRSVLLPPATFLQRPVRWLRAISDYRATVSGAPNFAYDLCARRVSGEEKAGLRLDSWRLAFCGAEPVRPQTLEQFAQAFAEQGFRSQAYYPCYGLAESTLLVTGGYGPQEPTVKRVRRSSLAEHRVEEAHCEREALSLVSCGRTHLDQEVKIVEPTSAAPCAEGEVGEIWVRGPSVAQGYWNRPEESEATFRARLADSGEGPYLRTGDLGFVSQGQLFVTGRAKDVIIVRGRNHYPQDIERTAQEADSALVSGAGAAFAVDRDGDECLVLVQEVSRGTPDEQMASLANRVRAAVAEEHEVDLYSLVLIRQASLPMTTSGKVQRALCREQYLAGQLRQLFCWVHPAYGSRGSLAAGANGAPLNGTASPRRKPAPIEHRVMSPEEVGRLAEKIERFLLEWLVERAGVPQQQADRQRPFAEAGLDSLSAVELSRELEDWLRVPITPIVAFNYPTPAALARYLAEQVGGGAEPAERPAPAGSGDRFEQLLQEIEGLSDEAALAALRSDHRPGGAG